MLFQLPSSVSEGFNLLALSFRPKGVQAHIDWHNCVLFQPEPCPFWAIHSTHLAEVGHELGLEQGTGNAETIQMDSLLIHS